MEGEHWNQLLDAHLDPTFVKFKIRTNIVGHVLDAVAAIGAEFDGVVELLIVCDVRGQGAVGGALVVDMDLNFGSAGESRCVD